jgi:hypothetical protein
MGVYGQDAGAGAGVVWYEDGAVAYAEKLGS